MDLLDDRWNDREFPVLREAARRFDRDPRLDMVPLWEISAETKIDVHETQAAARALEGAGLIEMLWAGGAAGSSLVKGISAEARVKVGLWPSPETALDRMVAALEAIAENSSDEDTRSRARKIIDAISGAGRDLGIAVASAAITGQIQT
jgi:hypothetical protein